MVVGDNVAVLGDDKAASGGGRLHPLTENVGGHGRAVDAHNTVHCGGIHLSRGHEGLAGDLFHCNLLGSAIALLDGSLAAFGQRRTAVARCAANHRTGQQQGGNLYTGLVPEGGLFRHRRGLMPALVLLGAVVIMVEIVGITVSFVLGSVIVILVHKETSYLSFSFFRRGMLVTWGKMLYTMFWLNPCQPIVIIILLFYLN